MKTGDGNCSHPTRRPQPPPPHNSGRGMYAPSDTDIDLCASGQPRNPGHMVVGISTQSSFRYLPHPRPGRCWPRYWSPPQPPRHVDSSGVCLPASWLGPIPWRLETGLPAQNLSKRVILDNPSVTHRSKDTTSFKFISILPYLHVLFTRVYIINSSPAHPPPLTHTYTSRDS